MDGIPSATSSSSSHQQGNQTTVNALAHDLVQISLLDLVFVIDSTGSMGAYILRAQQTIQSIVEEIVSKEKADVRFALVAYRDHPPEDTTFVTKVYDFTSSVSRMKANLLELSAQGGGDEPEAVVDGLYDACKLEYRPGATKICILIADAPPHGLITFGDHFPEGCPCQLDPMVVCRQMVEKGIILYCIGCEPSLSPYKEFFMALCFLTGGQYCPLSDASVLSQVVVGGVAEEISLERIMGDVRAELASERCQAMSEEEQAKFVQEQLQTRGVKVKQLQVEGGDTDALAVTPQAVALSALPNLYEVKHNFSPANAPSVPFPSFGGSVMAASARAAPLHMLAKEEEKDGIPRDYDSFESSGYAPRHALSFAAIMPAAAPSLSTSSPTLAPPSSYKVGEGVVSFSQAARLVSRSKGQSG